MGGHHKHPKRRGKDFRKTKYKDPFKNPLLKVKESANAPPVDDEGLIDIPKITGGAFMPAGDAGGPAAASPAAPGAAPKLTAKQAKIAKKRKASEMQQERGMQGNKATLNTRSETSTAQNADSTDLRQNLPKQKPGESAKAYAARVDKALLQQLRDARRKVSTERHREKKRNQRAKKKKAADDKVGQKKAEADGLFARGDRAKFGDIAERPPILSSAAMKSRSKLKEVASKAKPGGSAAEGKSSPAKKDMAGELADYASKVREAYAAMKKRRLAG